MIWSNEMLINQSINWFYYHVVKYRQIVSLTLHMYGTKKDYGKTKTKPISNKTVEQLTFVDQEKRHNRCSARVKMSTLNSLCNMVSSLKKYHAQPVQQLTI